MSQTSSVTVAVRARPFLPRDEGQRDVIRIIQPADPNGNPTVALDVLTTQLSSSPRYEQKLFAFDHAFGGDSTQEEVFETLGRKIVGFAQQGFNACIFAYGQTGSGKSHSIIGPPEDEGLIPRVSRELPWVDDQSSGSDCEAGGGGPGGGGGGDDGSKTRVTVSFLEIYNEQLRDLLNPTARKKPLYVHQHPKLGVYVPHLTEAPVTNHVEAMSRLDYGSKIRVGVWVGGIFIEHNKCLVRLQPLSTPNTHY